MLNQSTPFPCALQSGETDGIKYFKDKKNQKTSSKHSQVPRAVIPLRAKIVDSANRSLIRFHRRDYPLHKDFLR